MKETGGITVEVEHFRTLSWSSPIPSIYRWGSWGPVRVNDSPKVAQLDNDKPRRRTGFQLRGCSFNHIASKVDRGPTRGVWGCVTTVLSKPESEHFSWRDSEDKAPAWASSETRLTKPVSVYLLSRQNDGRKIKGQGSNACFIKLVTAPTLLWEGARVRSIPKY